MPKGKIILLPSNAAIGTVSFEIAHINVTGDRQFPILSIPIEVALVAGMENQQGKQQAIRPISLLHITGEFASPQNRVISRFQQPIGLTARHPHVPEAKHSRFEIPLNIRALAKIEETRSGDLQCALTLMPLLAIHATELNNAGVQQFTIGRVEGFAFTVPWSQWIDLLPQLGYGGLELLEVRYGPGVSAFHLPKSVEEIQNAKKYLRAHDWEKAVSHCRKAIEVILESRPSSLPPQTQFRVKVETFINDHLTSLGDPEAKLLSEQMRMIWEAASQVVHPNSAPSTKRADAEFLLRATMALVEYFSKLLK